MNIDYGGKATNTATMERGVSESKGSRVYKEDIKRKKLSDKKRKEMVDTIENIITALRQKSSLCTSSEF